jgi:hypothetical protein
MYLRNLAYTCLIGLNVLFNQKMETLFSLFNLKTETVRNSMIYNVFLFNSETERQFFLTFLTIPYDTKQRQ